MGFTISGFSVATLKREGIEIDEELLELEADDRLTWRSRFDEADYFDAVEGLSYSAAHDLLQLLKNIKVDQLQLLVTGLSGSGDGFVLIGDETTKILNALPMVLDHDEIKKKSASEMARYKSIVEILQIVFKKCDGGLVIFS